jgi:hypothetical protein
MREPPPVRGAPVFDNYSDSNEEYTLTSTTPSSWSLGGLEEKRVTACREAPVLDNHSDSNEEYTLTSTTPSSWSLGGLEFKGVTTCREAPILDNHSDSDDKPESISCSHWGLTITYTPQGWFVYWKVLEPFELLEYDSPLWPSRKNYLFRKIKVLRIALLWLNPPFAISTLGSWKILTTPLNFSLCHNIDVLQR